jgi:hypothetical protein
LGQVRAAAAAPSRLAASTTKCAKAGRCICRFARLLSALTVVFLSQLVARFVGSTDARNRVLDASVSSDRSAQDRSKAKPDEVVQTPVVRLSGRAASRATNASAVRAAEILLTHRVIWKFAD